MNAMGILTLELKLFNSDYILSPADSLNFQPYFFFSTLVNVN